VILAVVAAAKVATVAPLRAKSEQKLADQQMATLHSMATRMAGIDHLVITELAGPHRAQQSRTIPLIIESLCNR